jgi:hypothetical protein
VLIVLLTITAFLGWRMMPIADGDPTWWGPVLINAANGDGYHSEFCPPPGSHDPSGGGRFLWHGFTGVMLQAHLLALLPGPATLEQLFAVHALISGVALVLAWWWWRRVAPTTTWSGALLAGGGLIALATQFAGVGFRPEPMITVLVLATLLFLHAVPDRHRPPIAGIALGLIIVGHPVPGVLLALLWTVVETVRHPPTAAITRIAVSAGVSVATIAAYIVVALPFPLADWLWGLRANARHAILDVPDAWLAVRAFIDGWMFQAGSPFLGISVLGAVILGGCWCARAAPRRWTVALAIALLLGTAFYFLRAPGRTYNLVPLWPLLVPAVALAAVPYRRLVDAGFGLSQAMIGAGLAYFIAAAWWTWGATATIDEARAATARLIAHGDGPVAASFGLWPLHDDHRVLVCWDPDPDPPGTTWAILQQANRGRQEPPMIPGYTIVEDRFARGRPRIFGIAVANTFGGYGYAVYRRDSPGPNGIRQR